MVAKADFKQLVEMAMQNTNYQQMRPVIEKELLHFDILFCLERAGILSSLTFQGGTALRLCHGASRFSEDLDFAGGSNFSLAEAQVIKQCVEDYIGRRYALDVSVKPPKKDKINAQKRDEVIVNRWQIRITTAEARPDLPKQMIRLEVANVEAYTREPKSLVRHYDCLPDGYDDFVLLVESLDEILADKLVAFVNCERYIRYRDIWDIRWLLRKGATFSVDLLSKKIHDYGALDYEASLRRKQVAVENIIRSHNFQSEMRRFLPKADFERTLSNSHYLTMLIHEIKLVLSNVEQAL